MGGFGEVDEGRKRHSGIQQSMILSCHLFFSRSADASNAVEFLRSWYIGRGATATSQDVTGRSVVHTLASEPMKLASGQMWPHHQPTTGCGRKQYGVALFVGG